MTSRLQPLLSTWTAPVLAGAARVGLGALWLHEGLFKLHAHFGASDINLVVSSVDGNSRVPGYFRTFIDASLAQAPGFFGAVVPILELTLGILLIVGLGTLPAALMSAMNLTAYWSSDQLIAQYPIMLGLTVAVVVFAAAAARFSLTTVAMHRAHLQPHAAFRRWL